MKQLREEQNEALNATRDNGTTENTEELDKLRQTLEYKEVDVMEISKEQYMLMEQLNEL